MTDLFEQHVLSYIDEYERRANKLLEETDIPNRRAELRNLLCAVLPLRDNPDDADFADLIEAEQRLHDLEEDPTSAGKHDLIEMTRNAIIKT